jgi:hypothetical protein
LRFRRVSIVVVVIFVDFDVGGVSPDVLGGVHGDFSVYHVFGYPHFGSVVIVGNSYNVTRILVGDDESFAWEVSEVSKGTDMRAMRAGLTWIVVYTITRHGNYCTDVVTDGS